MGKLDYILKESLIKWIMNKGGFDCDYSSDTKDTTLEGALIIEIRNHDN